MVKEYQWSTEALAKLSNEYLKNVRANAARSFKEDLLALCDAEMASRKPPKKAKVKKDSTSDGPVTGYHFKCKREQGVTANPDGTLWTGTWAVAEFQAERSLKVGAYVALHEKKAEASYLQGDIKEWRVSKRQKEYAPGRKVKKETGIDFLIKPTDQSYDWVGDGSGERGYNYSPRAQG